VGAMYHVYVYVYVPVGSLGSEIEIDYYRPSPPRKTCGGTELAVMYSPQTTS
jgi:hypothetical protein